MSLQNKIKSISKKFLKVSEEKEIQIISHFDTDGITSATIMIKTLKKLDSRFSVKIVKSLKKEIIEKLSKEKVILFLDLASNFFKEIQATGLKDVFIIDHHQVTQKVPEEINIINPELEDKQKISASGLTYLFCKQIDAKNREFAKLAILGMIGDFLEKEIDNLDQDILKENEIQKIKGLLFYPSTRPLNRTLEFCSSPYIPGVTGNQEGVIELLREAEIGMVDRRYKNIIELTEKEMKKLVTAIILRNPKAKQEKITGDIFLLKMFNKLEDARELSAKINACSRLGFPGIGIQFCMEISESKKQAESIHAQYKQHIVSGLRIAEEKEKISGKNFIIINAKDEIKDTIIGVIASILSASSVYEEGTVIIAMAHNKDQVKVSARIAGRKGKNVQEILSRVVNKIGGEVGGHEQAAGCTITRDKEQKFINLIKRNLEVEVVKI